MMFISLLGAAAAYQALGGHVGSAGATHRLTTPQMAMHVRQVVHRVAALQPVSTFYQECFGFKELSSNGGRTRLGSGAEGALCVELLDAGTGYDPTGGYRGLHVRVPSVADALSAVEQHGGSVVSRATTFEYGPSLEPDEDEESTTPVLEALVADPSGYPLRLWEAEGTTTALSTIRLDVLSWKKSVAWYEETGGLTKLRWASMVPKEAAILVTMGPQMDPLALGPCGPLGDEERAVVQLQYKYNAESIDGDGGLDALVLGGKGEGSEETDLDNYKVRFE